MLTEKEQIASFKIMRHMERLRNLINDFVKELLNRGEVHDQCKLESPEIEILANHMNDLPKSTYGEKEYDNNLEGDLKPALEHHYAHSRHHPQHHSQGINDMNLVDLVEMFLDWKASSELHHDGNILKSISVNKNKFGMSGQLVKIFENTAKAFDGV